MAVGGHDKAIYIFSLVEREDVGRVWEMKGKCKVWRLARQDRITIYGKELVDLTQIN